MVRTVPRRGPPDALTRHAGVASSVARRGGGFGLAGCTAAPQWRPLASDAEPQTLATIDGEAWWAPPVSGCAAPRARCRCSPPPATDSEAGWWSLTGAGGRLVGIGRTHGGAHSNARWSVFVGDARSGLTEREQPSACSTAGVRAP
ncbi:MAG: hypothetical protein R2719_04955 [Micropruina sp.]